MSEDESITQLQMLGLNLYESRAYLALLNAKQLTAKGVGQRALIPQSRTYDVLESLTSKGFALATPSSPPTYVPVAPTKILGPAFDSERKRIKERATKVQEDAQAKLDGIREAYLALTRDFPSAPASQQLARDQVWVLQERENIENTLSGFIRDAKSMVFRVTKPPEPKSKQPLDPFYIVGMENKKFVDDALDSGVKMRWLSLEREIPTFAGLEIDEPPERRYLEHDDDITEKFLLVDNRAVLLNLHDPMSSTYGYVALAMQSSAVSSIFLEHFEKMWKKAKPLGEVLPRMKQLVDEVGEEIQARGLGKTEATVYRTLARLGAVGQDVLIKEMGRRRVRPQVTLAACDRMMKLGIIHRDNSLRLLMVEHPTSVKRSWAADKTKPGLGAKITTDNSPSGKNL
jgi:sugar-specific transcriptional regulator TrmB